MTDGQFPQFLVSVILKLKILDLVQAFFTCSQYRVVGLGMLGWVKNLLHEHLMGRYTSEVITHMTKLGCQE